MAVIASRPHYAAHLAAVDIGDLDVALVASYQDLVTAQAAGHRKIVLMQHGIGQSYSGTNPGYPGGAKNDAVGLFLTPNHHSARRWQEAYPGARVEAVGSPRIDSLPRREPGPLTIAITFHWRFSAFAFYRNAIRDLAEQFHVIGHGHPRASSLPRFWAKAGIEHVADFDEVCQRADLLIADNTSAMFEFASTGRPVVVLNCPDYRRDIDHGLRFWEAADVGVNVERSDDLPAAVAEALEDAPERQAAREAALATVYVYRSGAGQRASDVIREWAA